MSRRGARVRLEEGIFRDGLGLAAVVKVGQVQREKRFPAGTDRRQLREWRRVTRASLELDLATPEEAPPVITLAEDVAAYLALLPEGPAKADVAMLLGHWTRAHGTTQRSALTAPVIHAQLLAWLRDGAAPQTCNHRRRALVTLTKTLDGATAPNPAREAPKLRVPPSAPRWAEWALVAQILDALTVRKGLGKTRARLMVIATTGWPHAVLARLQPRDLHLTATPPYAVIRPRQKGAGVPARAIPLTPRAVDALRLFVAENAFGPFSRRSLWKTFKLAAGKVGAPADLRPYDLRHGFAASAYRASRDIHATKELLMHASLSTTAKYAAAAVTDASQAAIRSLAGTEAGTAAKPSENRRKAR